MVESLDEFGEFVDDILSMDTIIETLEKEVRRIKIRLEKRRWGREVTIIEGLDENSAEETVKKLKSILACGGTYKNGMAVLQGDHRFRVKELLIKMGYPEENIVVE